ncbi:MAG: hypothetical protein DKM23_05445 [Candidatus Melainabacteria bacterium]|nr:MAG: hypothetical protein DKM23_05445 [Candidatus Melainabacteria bacterium]
MFEFFKNLFNNKDEEEEDLLTKLPDNVALLNNQGSFLWCNDVAQKTLSKLKENFSEGYIDNVFDNAMDLIVKIAESGLTKVIKAKTPDEKDMFFEFTARKTEEGYLVCFRDNTQSYKTLTSIFVEHESLRKTNKDKNNFLVKLSGDFRNPLQSIVGFSQALLGGIGGELNEKQAKYVNIINKNSTDVLYLIDKILELSKAESNLFEKKLGYFDAINILNNVIKNNEKDAQAKNIEINVEVAKDVKRTIYSDEAMLKIVLENIIESAIKFTDVGSINIEVSHPDLELVSEKGFLPVENAKEKSYIMFKIDDQSLGISDIELENLFEPYAQLDNPNKNNVFRSIAFATIKNIIRIMKGNVWVEPEAMHGTTYCVIIPAEKVMQSENE